MSSEPAQTTQPVVDIAGLHFRYPGAQNDAVVGLDLRIHEGELVAVVGANGSGKSTLARLVGGLDRPAKAGRARVCGHDLLTAEGRLAARRDVGVLFQNPENQLVAQCVEEDVAFGLENLGWETAEIQRRVDEMLVRFRLEELRLREPHLLSGGQKQRTALAGVLAVPRSLLVLDEPSAMLDSTGRCEVLAAVERLRAEGLTIMHVTQEMDDVVGADRVIALERGTQVYSGAVAGLFADASMIRSLRLGLPAAGEVALALAERGRGIEGLPLTMEELLAGLESRA
jgi:energy-coupling factor transport system ATP-binding protein